MQVISLFPSCVHVLHIYKSLMQMHIRVYKYGDIHVHHMFLGAPYTLTTLPKRSNKNTLPTTSY